jgi:ATP-dependent exoDNAse (exonuclease V) beta subunit
MTHEDDQVSEQFVVSMKDKMCGTIDVLVNKGKKHVVIRDFKTGDIYKKISLTPQAKELWPQLKAQMISVYQLQLSFYAYLLSQLGYTVEGTEIWAEGVEAWQVVKLPILDIRKGLEAV